MNDELDTNPEKAAEMAANSVLRYMAPLDLPSAMDKVVWTRKVWDIIFARIQQSSIHSVALLVALVPVTYCINLQAITDLTPF